MAVDFDEVCAWRADIQTAADPHAINDLFYSLFSVENLESIVTRNIGMRNVRLLELQHASQDTTPQCTHGHPKQRRALPQQELCIK